MDHDLHSGLCFLSLRTRVAAESQLFRATGLGQAKTKLLARMGLIERRRTLANPPRPLAAPVATFNFPPGKAPVTPSFGDLSRRLKAREPDGPEELVVVFANEKAADLTGGVAASIKPFELHHDLQATEVLLAHGVPEGWRSEDFLARDKLSLGKFVPDAAIVEGGRIVRAIEYGGPSYEPERIEKIWRACYETQTPLELW